MLSKIKLFGQWQWLGWAGSLISIVTLLSPIVAASGSRDPFSPGVMAQRSPTARPKFTLVSTTIACEPDTTTACYYHTAVLQQGSHVQAVQRGDSYAGWRVAEITATSVRLIQISNPTITQTLTLKDQNDAV